jgi:hypothetical protein
MTGLEQVSGKILERMIESAPTKKAAFMFGYKMGVKDYKHLEEAFELEDDETPAPVVSLAASSAPPADLSNIGIDGGRANWGSILCLDNGYFLISSLQDDNPGDSKSALNFNSIEYNNSADIRLDLITHGSVKVFKRVVIIWEKEHRNCIYITRIKGVDAGFLFLCDCDGKVIKKWCLEATDD